MFARLLRAMAVAALALGMIAYFKAPVAAPNLDSPARSASAPAQAGVR